MPPVDYWTFPVWAIYYSNSYCILLQNKYSHTKISQNLFITKVRDTIIVHK